MLDIRFIRENPDIVKKDLEKRQDKEKLKWVDDLLKKDEDYRHLLQKNQELRHKRNLITSEINALKNFIIISSESCQQFNRGITIIFTFTKNLLN